MKRKFIVLGFIVLVIIVFAIVYFNPFDPYSADRKILTGSWICIGEDPEINEPLLNATRLNLYSDGTHNRVRWSEDYNKWISENGTWELQTIKEIRFTSEDRYHNVLVLKRRASNAYFKYNIYSNEKISLCKWMHVAGTTWSRQCIPVYFIRR